MKFLILTIVACLSIACANAQPGCTDPQALNFNAAATSNDGSCEYPSTSYLPQLVTELSPFITEASGLEYFNEKIWLHQDGGAGAVLYIMDTLTGQQSTSYIMGNLENVDWEDLAEDSANIYIGDFGNNSGDRTNLRIYKKNKVTLDTGPIAWDTIDFSFSDQTDFTPAYYANNFDCEAMLVLGDSIHIFTKRWLDKTTHHYVLPTTAGTYVAQLRDSFDTGFLVTSADISEDGTIVLLGYDGNTSVTSMLLLWDYPGTAIFSGNKRKITLGNALNMSQAEGVTFRTNTEGYICSEKISVLPPKLLRFNIRLWLENPTAAGEVTEEVDFTLSPNPVSDVLNIDYQGVGVEEVQFSLLRDGSRLLRSGKLQNGKNTINTADLPAGTYFLWVKKGDMLSVKKVVKI
jgi:hypothetical protein